MRYRDLRSTAAVLLFAATGLLVGCGSDSPTEPPVDVSGSYTLEAIDGASLPGLFFVDDAVSIEVLEGSLLLTPHGGFEELLTFLETEVGSEEGSLVEYGTVGTYSTSSSGVVFSTAEGAWSGTYLDGTIAYTILGVLFTFRRLSAV